MAYTNIDDPSAHFQVETYTGNSSSPRSVTLSGNSDMKPDWTWIKTRSGPYYHYLFDSSRTSGSSYYRLVSSENFAETVDSVSQLTAFTTDGFTLTGSGSMANVNWSTQNYVAWNWKANGGTTSSNTDGDINSTVQVNSDAGFSIVTYTGNFTGSQGVGHGLGVRPDVVIIKNRSGANDWVVWTSELTSGNFLKLNDTAAQSSSSRIYQNGYTTSTFGIGANNTVNKNSNNYVAYCFNNVQGFSKFGSYEGNSNANGPFIYTGFKPAFVMLKPNDIAEHWVMHDGARDPFNKTYHYLFANENEAEASGGTHHIDLLSNGFKIRTSNNNWNASSTVIYMAFAENPFVTSTGIPTTAR